MALIALARIDDRLVHGQVVTKWVQRTKSNHIIIVDDTLAQNSFLADVYKMAAPVGVTVSVKSTKQAADEWKENQFGDGTVLLLFKNPQNVQKACENGIHIESLQVAGMGSASGKKVYKTVSLSEDDAQVLQKFSQQGIHVYFQALPEDKPTDIGFILKKHFKNL